jgi:hypothetical protein
MEGEEGKFVEGVPMSDAEMTGKKFEKQQKQQKLKEVLQMQREDKIYADVQSRQAGAHSAEEKRRYDLAMAQLSAQGGTARGVAAEEQRARNKARDDADLASFHFTRETEGPKHEAGSQFLKQQAAAKRAEMAQAQMKKDRPAALARATTLRADEEKKRLLHEHTKKQDAIRSQKLQKIKEASQRKQEQETLAAQKEKQAQDARTRVAESIMKTGGARDVMRVLPERPEPKSKRRKTLGARPGERQLSLAVETEQLRKSKTPPPTVAEPEIPKEEALMGEGPGVPEEKQGEVSLTPAQPKKKGVVAPAVLATSDKRAAVGGGRAAKSVSLVEESDKRGGGADEGGLAAKSTSVADPEAYGRPQPRASFSLVKEKPGSEREAFLRAGGEAALAAKKPEQPVGTETVSQQPDVPHSDPAGALAAPPSTGEEPSSSVDQDLLSLQTSLGGGGEMMGSQSLEAGGGEAFGMPTTSRDVWAGRWHRGPRDGARGDRRGGCTGRTATARSHSGVGCSAAGEV